jgi:hypothetical protein
MSHRHAGTAEPGTALWAPLCPLCGRANECAVSASGRFDVPCWCTEVTIDPAVLARARGGGRACICRACALGQPGAQGGQSNTAQAAPAAPRATAK